VEFLAGLFGCEHPLDPCLLCISLLLPGSHLGDHLVFVVDPAVEALAFQDTDLDLNHIQPACVFRRVVEFKSL
jgi:hypothetical protein